MRLSFLALALATAALPAIAGTTLKTGGTLEYYPDRTGSGTPDRTDVTIYGKLDFGGAHVGAGAQKSSDDLKDELSAYFGYRGDLGSVGYDIGYTQYTYPNDSPSNYGEIGLELSADLDDKASGKLELGYDATNQRSKVSVEAVYAASDVLKLSANFEVKEVAGGWSEREWDFGLTYSVRDKTDVDLRYYDGSDYVDGYFGVILGFDTSILK